MPVRRKNEERGWKEKEGWKKKEKELHGTKEKASHRVRPAGKMRCQES